MTGGQSTGRYEKSWDYLRRGGWRSEKMFKSVLRVDPHQKHRAAADVRAKRRSWRSFLPASDPRTLIKHQFCSHFCHFLTTTTFKLQEKVIFHNLIIINFQMTFVTKWKSLFAALTFVTCLVWSWLVAQPRPADWLLIVHSQSRAAGKPIWTHFTIIKRRNPSCIWENIQ